MNKEGDFYNHRKYLIVFEDQTPFWFLKGLSVNFRHCYALIPAEEGAGWILYDPLSNRSRIQFLTRNYVRLLIRHLYEKNRVILPVSLPPTTARKMAPFLPFTCVEAIKRLLGIHCWSVLTPYQLYKYLLAHRQEFNIERSKNMGGFISRKKAPALPALPPVEDGIKEDKAPDEKQARLEDLRRRRRGRLGTVTSSWKGVDFQGNAKSTPVKTLLGE